MQRAHTLARHLKRKLVPLRFPKTFLHKNVPYFAQWESRELVRDILDKKVLAQDDPRWRESGAQTADEYESWSWACCGMACTKMLLAHAKGVVVPLLELAKKCTKYGGYTMPLEDSKGLIYRPYVRFLKQEFGLRARVLEHVSIEEIMSELGKGKYVIASVNAAIRRPESTPPNKGGHLILLLGYDTKKRELYFHNPSGNTKKSQEYAAVSFDHFGKFFSGRCIVIDAP